MAIFLKKSTLNKRVYLQLADGVYDPKTKKSKQSVYKKLGYLDELEKEYNNPIEYFKAEAKKINEKRKNTNAEEIPENPQLLNLGNFPFRKLFKELNVARTINGYQVLKQKHDQFSLSQIFEMLLYAQIINPKSKNFTYNYTKDTFFQKYNFSSSQMYDAIEELGEDGDAIFEGIQLSISDKYKRNFKNVYFDCTNYYFEIDKPTEILKPGPSKEERSNPILGLGLLLDGNSIPLDYQLYPGNESEKPILRNILKDMKEKNGIKGKVIRIADKGLNCGDNIADAYMHNDGYIFSQTVKGASDEIKRWVLNSDGYIETKDSDGNIVYKIKSFVDKHAEINITINGKKTKHEIIQKQIVFWSRDFAQKSALEREKALEKLNKVLKTESQTNKAKYGFVGKYVNEDIIDDEGEIVDAIRLKMINREKVDLDSKLDGYYMLVTSETNEPSEHIIDAYRTLWEIEESFRITKTTLKTRPVYHSLENAIKGHFLICMTALLFIRMVEKMKLNSKIPASSLVESLRRYQCVKEDTNRYQLLYIDENLKTMSQFYSLKLNQHYKTESEIKKLF